MDTMQEHSYQLASSLIGVIVMLLTQWIVTDTRKTIGTTLPKGAR